MTQPDHRIFMKHFLAAEAVLKAYLLSACGDMNAADELLGEVSSVLWEKFDSYDTAREFCPWAIGVARLEVLKWRQSLARKREVLSPEAIDPDISPSFPRRRVLSRPGGVRFRVFYSEYRPICLRRKRSSSLPGQEITAPIITVCLSRI